MSNEPTLDSAGKALSDFASGPVVSATRSIEEAVSRTFSSMETSIARAVTTGKASMSDFVSSVLSSLDRLAARQYIAAPLENLVGDLVSSLLPVAGARAEGGPVDSGQSYLVGEKGPELFVPSSAGSIVPNARSSVVLNVAARDATSFLKSETQLAAMLSRALSRSQRNL
jgi:phage-related minor tail protein